MRLNQLLVDRHSQVSSQYVFYYVCLCFLLICENNFSLNSMKMLIKFKLKNVITTFLMKLLCFFSLLLSVFLVREHTHT